MSDARALYKEGFRHFTEDELDEAIACYRHAVEQDPALAIAWNGLSLALRDHGDLDGAIEAGKRLAALEPDEPLSHTNLSVLYQNAGRIQDAEDEKALAMSLQMKAQRGT
jgi:tetratricopeptide (TPR) repeat protein